MLQILQKQLDESTLCPLCQASMYWIEAEQYEQELNFHECSHCEHRIFQNSQQQNCHCVSCTQQRKKIMGKPACKNNKNSKNRMHLNAN